MLEGREITSQQTILAVFQERILIFCQAQAPCVLRITAQFTFFNPNNILTAFRSIWRFCWVHAGLVGELEAWGRKGQANISASAGVRNVN